MTNNDDVSSATWQLLEREKNRDRHIKRLSVAAWTVTHVALLAYAMIVLSRVVHTWRLVQVGAMEYVNLFDALVPLLLLLVGGGTLVAILTTLVQFMRFRTASLAEIQARLVSLESVLMGRSDDR